MRILNYDELKIERDAIIDDVRRGAIFIHPTDTIYGIGCNAQIPQCVKKVRELKARAANPFSVIAPSLEWIEDNCIVTEQGKKWLNRLPGPYTLIFKLKKNCVAKEVNPGLVTLGIRIPNHWIKDLVAEASVPVVTTSVNGSNEDYMTSLEDLNPLIGSGVDFTLYEGKKEGKPSKIIDLTGAVKVIER